MSVQTIHLPLAWRPCFYAVKVWGGSFLIVLHSPDDGGDLAPGQGVVQLIDAGAAGGVSLHNAGCVQGLDAGVVRVGEGLDAGEIAFVQFHGPGGQLGHLQADDELRQIHVAAGDNTLGPGLRAFLNAARTPTAGASRWQRLRNTENGFEALEFKVSGEPV